MRLFSSIPSARRNLTTASMPSPKVTPTAVPNDPPPRFFVLTPLLPSPSSQTARAYSAAFSGSRDFGITLPTFITPLRFVFVQYKFYQIPQKYKISRGRFFLSPGNFILSFFCMRSASCRKMRRTAYTAPTGCCTPPRGRFRLSEDRCLL